LVFTQKNIQEIQLKNFVDTKVVKGLGMPLLVDLTPSEQKETNGDLIIRYDVQLPQYKIVKDSHSIIKILLDKGSPEEPDRKGPIYKTSKYKKNVRDTTSTRTINECHQM